MDYKDINNGYKVYESLHEGELKESLKEVLSYADSCYVSDAEETATGIISNVEEIEDRIVETARLVVKEIFINQFGEEVAENISNDFKENLLQNLYEGELTIKVKKEV